MDLNLLLSTGKRERKSLRFVPNELTELEVILKHGSKAIKGYLGNISETGFNLILDNSKLNKELISLGAEIQGEIKGKEKKDNFDFEGIIIWIDTEKLLGNGYLVAGVCFQTGFILPDSFYKMKLSKED